MGSKEEAEWLISSNHINKGRALGPSCEGVEYGGWGATVLKNQVAVTNSISDPPQFATFFNFVINERHAEIRIHGASGRYYLFGRGGLKIKIKKQVHIFS